MLHGAHTVMASNHGSKMASYSSGFLHKDVSQRRPVIKDGSLPRTAPAKDPSPRSKGSLLNKDGPYVKDGIMLRHRLPLSTWAACHMVENHAALNNNIMYC